MTFYLTFYQFGTIVKFKLAERITRDEAEVFRKQAEAALGGAANSVRLIYEEIIE